MKHLNEAQLEDVLVGGPPPPRATWIETAAAGNHARKGDHQARVTCAATLESRRSLFRRLPTKSLALSHDPPPEALAHLTENGRAHLLADHLECVGKLAAQSARAFGSAEWARLAGRWHDLGKYAGNFQKMIREANGFEAHIEGDVSGPRDHSTAGAIHACRALDAQGLPVAFAIAGHHAGLSDLVDLKTRLKNKNERYQAALAGGAPTSLLEAEPPSVPGFIREDPSPKEQSLRVEFWTRMLFSALCDADFLDTEAFYDDTRTALRGTSTTLEALEAALTSHLERLSDDAPPTEVNRVRADVLQACRAAAPKPPGIFALTVPTGGGKTLASMAFALAHARHHELERVVVAIPYTSIIEQNASVYRTVLGKEHVLEHHSALDPVRETPKNRIACENWDAPVVVTTTVQLFESLFANRTSRCRKLHRLARSIIILDEAQTLPPGLLTPILDGLRALARDYGATIIISTATQPAFRRPGLACGFDEVTEIVPREVEAFSRLRRVRVVWPTSPAPVPYADLAAQVGRERDVLAIVHRRRDARELTEAVDDVCGDTSTLHLSALMCPEHRSRVLDGIKSRKAGGDAVRLVSTQLVEAGVDLDFAVVYRALAGLDSLAQAAGRCNREGRLSGQGDLRVFVPPTEPPKGVPRAAMAVAEGMIRAEGPLDLDDPGVYQRYFEQLYGSRNLDTKDIQALRAKLHFKTVAREFSLIEDDWSAPLVVPYGTAPKRVADLDRWGPSRGRLRALQRFTITVERRRLEAWIQGGIVRRVADTVSVLDELYQPAYDERFGLLPDRVGQVETGSLVV